MGEISQINTSKVLIISEVFFPEEFLINDLVFEWKRQGRQISVLTRSPSYPKGTVFEGYRNRFFQKELVNDIPVYRVQFIPGYQDNRLVKVLNYLWNMILASLWSIKNGKKFEVVYIYQTGPLTFSLAGILIKKLYRKKTIIWIQDAWPDTVFAYGIATRGLARKILVAFVKWIYKNCDHITVSCPGFIPLIRQYCPDKTPQFVPQWSLTPKVTNKEPQALDFSLPGAFNFVFAGNLGKVQNLENVISGFDNFLKSGNGSAVWLNIFGDGSHRSSLEDLVARKQVGQVKFWGRVDIARMPEIYSRADVLIISLENKPVFNLTIPAKFQSYLSAGKPMLGIIGGEVATLIARHGLGWVAQPDNVEDIADVFNLIADCTPAILAEKSAGANRLTAEQFNRELIIKTITDLVWSPIKQPSNVSG